MATPNQQPTYSNNQYVNGWSIEYPLIKEQTPVNHNMNHNNSWRGNDGNGIKNQDRASGVDLIPGRQYNNYGRENNPQRNYQNGNQDKNRKNSVSSGSDENTPQQPQVSKCFYYTSLAIWIVALEAIGAIIGITSNSGRNGWYENLNRSSANPPGVVFSIVWPILYFMIAISGWILQFAPSDVPRLTLIRVLFGIQLVLNWCWSPFFFTLHEVVLSFVVIITMVVIVGLIIILSFEKMRAVSVLMLPYLLWLCFASYLNGYIMVNN